MVVRNPRVLVQNVLLKTQKQSGIYFTTYYHIISLFAGKLFLTVTQTIYNIISCTMSMLSELFLAHKKGNVHKNSEVMSVFFIDGSYHFMPSFLNRRLVFMLIKPKQHQPNNEDCFWTFFPPLSSRILSLGNSYFLTGLVTKARSLSQMELVKKK